jgi:hypothetical protein
MCFLRISPLEIEKNAGFKDHESEKPRKPLPKPAEAGNELCNGTKTKPCKKKGNGNYH